MKFIVKRLDTYFNYDFNVCCLNFIGYFELVAAMYKELWEQVGLVIVDVIWIIIK